MPCTPPERSTDKSHSFTAHALASCAGTVTSYLRSLRVPGYCQCIRVARAPMGNSIMISRGRAGAFIHRCAAYQGPHKPPRAWPTPHGSSEFKWVSPNHDAFQARGIAARQLGRSALCLLHWPCQQAGVVTLPSALSGPGSGQLSRRGCAAYRRHGGSAAPCAREIPHPAAVASRGAPST